MYLASTVGKTVPRATAAVNAFWHPDVYSVISHAVHVLSMDQQVWTGLEASGAVISLLTLRRCFLIRNKPTPVWHLCCYKGIQAKSAANLLFPSILTGLQVRNSFSISAPDIVGSIPPRDCLDALWFLRAQFPDRYSRVGSWSWHDKPSWHKCAVINPALCWISLPELPWMTESECTGDLGFLVLLYALTL